MNLAKYKAQHVAILNNITRLRELAGDGIAEHAEDIAQLVIRMSATIKLHLSVEDRFLYPTLQEMNNRQLAIMGKQYQHEMTHIAEAYGGFAGRWNSAQHVSADPEGFRADANRVLKILYERMKREDHDFYPAIEAA